MSVDFPQSTASENVFILDAAFPVHQLDRARRIWIYLPPDYQLSKKRFPVIYMHDGQNLFDATTSYCGEWGVDKIMNSMDEQCIIVGIDNAGLQRLNEYNIIDHDEHGSGEGFSFLEFIAEDLKPFIDDKFRTKKAAANTIMAGSSMGGLITFYAGIYYPEVFGVLGVFSPSFWTNPLLADSLAALLEPSRHKKQRYFFDIGGKENPRMVQQMIEVSDAVRTISKAEVKAVIIPEGDHTEASWGMAFGRFWHWVLK